MKKLMLLSLLGMLTAITAQAQDIEEPRNIRREPPNSMATQGTLTPTPEMWFYEQERSRYEDTKSAVRRKAEFRAAQRAQREAAMKWYGLSNSRPTASPTPITGTYSPTWVGNTHDPYRWATGVTTVVVRPTSRY
jgi:hypothetical protein